MWYNKVANDISNIPDAVEYFEAELITARYECRITGSLEKAAASMPGVVEQRFTQLQEIEAILEYLNIELRRLKSSHFRKYLESYARALSSRNISGENLGIPLKCSTSPSVKVSPILKFPES